MRRAALIVLVLALLIAAADAATTFKFRSTLRDRAGLPITEKTAVTFKAYELADGGFPGWSRVKSIIPDSRGQFQILLEDIPDDLNFLEIKCGEETLNPRYFIGEAAIVPTPTTTPAPGMTTTTTTLFVIPPIPTTTSTTRALLPGETTTTVLATTTTTVAAPTTTAAVPTTTTSVTTTTLAPGALNTSPPISPVKMVFIHHSCGENLIGDVAWDPEYMGGLATLLRDNNYFLSDTNYGWGPTIVGDPYWGEAIGDHTDTSDWQRWFRDPANAPAITAALYAESGSNQQHTAGYGVYDRLAADPGGENEVIMFKSCYNNSDVGSSIADEQAIYNDLLTYFGAHTDKLFILLTPPGSMEVASITQTRDLCNWLVDESSGWLSTYPHNNVGVLDFYCVLSETGSHHRIVGDTIEHVFASGYDGISPYHDGDDHPNGTGNRKARDEFMPLINYYYNRWQGL
jgi:hypothetical protein